MFLQSISNFRGITIILIVMGHSYTYGLSSTGEIGNVLKNIITGGTSLFVFISGYMFYHVFYPRYGYSKFIKGKFKNVGVPYLLLGSVAVLAYYLLNWGYFNPVEYMVDPESAYRNGVLFQPSDSDATTALKYMLTGHFLTAYWYIPFVLLCFLTAPIHMLFIKSAPKSQLIIICSLSILSLFIHRAVEGTNPLQSLVYFTPIYLIGISVCMNKDKVSQYLDNKTLLLLLFVVVILSFYQSYTGINGNSHKPFFESDGIDVVFIQKIALIFLLYGALEKLSFKSKWLDTISDTSFAIFFIHPWLLLILEIADAKYFGGTLKSDFNITLYLGICSGIVVTSVFCAKIMKMVFRGSKKTRYLIGY
ncbi:acyltransferase [Vibrio lentus]|uniref:acyltransferase family protein n=1 Tax=Vibrio TaxID=662 RepID=UPI0002EFC953|nr:MULTISPECIES: acyltransferase [Vibrio]OCH62629.1 hypothetical protein A6E08_15995 [Vibrio lentus]PMI59551.1 hypothetical protein BCU41_22075 [Vibrio lentus]